MIGLYSHTIRSARRVCAKCARLDCVSHNWLIPPRAVLASVEAFSFQRMGDVASDADGNLAAGVGVAAGVIHGSECRRELPGVGAVVLAGEGRDSLNPSGQVEVRHRPKCER